MNYYSHFLLIYLHHFIFRSSVSAPVLNAQFVQSPSEESHFVDGQAVFCLCLQVAEYLHRRHPFAFFRFLGGTEVAEKELFQRGGLFKLLIGLFQDGFVGIVQPVAFALADGVHGLGVELAVVDGDVGFDGAGYFDADKTAASAGVGQQILLIAGTDKRSIAANFLNGGSVRFTQIYHRLLQQMLQEALLVDDDLVEFVDVDKEETT